MSGLTRIVGIILLVLTACPTPARSAGELCRRVFDGATHRPIQGAWVVSGDGITRTNSEGEFTLTSTQGSPLGFARLDILASSRLLVLESR